ncbi:MAG: hypothetical protein AAB268_01370 [Elusimicrobiota bacterium]
MTFRTSTSARPRVQAGIKLARLLELPEGDFAKQVRELEANVFFRSLMDARVISVQPYANAGFTARRFGGWELSTASDGVSALDGRGELAELLQRIGQERFEECFLREASFTDEERARLCGISREEVSRLRDMVTSLYVQEEFDSAASVPAPAKTYSAVAGITVDGGKPALAFFNREIWKGRYQVDEEMRGKMIETLPAIDAKRVDKFLRDLELLDRRKTTLYRVLEALIETQSQFFVSGDPDQRQPLTQRDLSDRLDISPSVLNRLISNKSIQLPWGLEAPLKVLLPSRKAMIRSRLHDLIRESPESSDPELAKKIDRLYGVKLSRRSIAQYRADLGVGNSRNRSRVSSALTA